MTHTSMDRLLGAGRSLLQGRADADRLEGRVGGGPSGAPGSARGPDLSRLLDRRAGLLRHVRGGAALDDALRFDARQRVVVKVHYFSHGGGGGASLKAHARYVARDAAGRADADLDILPDQAAGQERAQASGRGDGAGEAADHSRAHADDLTRGDAGRGGFYDAVSAGVDGAARAADWAARDKRHFRIILAPDTGAGGRLIDLPAFTREVMARAEAQLGARLSWVAVDHHDTGHPHTHLILRGRRAAGRSGGQDLVLPRDFVRHGLRDIARDVATEWLGARGRDDERRALAAEITRHAPTRLDRVLAGQLPPDGCVRVSALDAPDGGAELTQALRARARELARLGLATETARGVLAFTPDWQDRLKAMELHLNIRKRVMLERTAQREAEATRTLTRHAGRGLDR